MQTEWTKRIYSRLKGNEMDGDPFPRTSWCLHMTGEFPLKSFTHSSSCAASVCHLSRPRDGWSGQNGGRWKQCRIILISIPRIRTEFKGPVSLKEHREVIAVTLCRELWRLWRITDSQLFFLYFILKFQIPYPLERHTSQRSEHGNSNIVLFMRDSY